MRVISSKTEVTLWHHERGARGRLGCTTAVCCTNARFAAPGSVRLGPRWSTSVPDRQSDRRVADT